MSRFTLGAVGEIIPGLTLHGKPAPFPVINERAVRAGAGITFVLGLFAFFHAFYLSDFFYLSILVPVLFVDFFAKVILGTRFSPLSRLAHWIVRKQVPEYVGAVQKRFAWSIGLILSGTMLVLLFGLEISGLPNLIICGLCLTFMFAESAFGICVGCKLYALLLRYGIIATPVHRPVCPGNVCAIE
jgi:hypothetical protein